MYNHNFKCLDCSFKFGVESEIGDVVKLSKEISIRCPKCDKKWGDKKAKIEHQLAVAGMGAAMTKDRRRKLRKENVERSTMAIRQAAEFQTQHQEETVEVKRPAHAGAPTQTGPASVRVPKKVIESLEQKAMPN